MKRRFAKIYMGGRIHGQNRVVGAGMGSVLLSKGGPGGGSSYNSVDDYEATTGREVVGSGLDEKLSKLIVKPLTKKPHNIRFEM